MSELSEFHNDVMRNAVKEIVYQTSYGKDDYPVFEDNAGLFPLTARFTPENVEGIIELCRYNNNLTCVRDLLRNNAARLFCEDVLAFCEKKGITGDNVEKLKIHSSLSPAEALLAAKDAVRFDVSMNAGWSDFYAKASHGRVLKMDADVIDGYLHINMTFPGKPGQEETKISLCNADVSGEDGLELMENAFKETFPVLSDMDSLFPENSLQM